MRSRRFALAVLLAGGAVPGIAQTVTTAASAPQLHGPTDPQIIVTAP